MTKEQGGIYALACNRILEHESERIEDHNKIYISKPILKRHSSNRNKIIDIEN